VKTYKFIDLGKKEVNGAGAAERNECPACLCKDPSLHVHVRVLIIGYVNEPYYLFSLCFRLLIVLAR
jgi:hypothetical protein